MPCPRYPGGQGASGVEIAPSWTLYSGTPSALVDPGSLATGAAFDPVTGVWTFPGNTAHTTVVDGYRENMARFSFPLADIIPDFTDGESGLDLYFEALTRPVGATQFGLGIGVLSKDAANHATADGQMHGIHLAATWTDRALMASGYGGQVTHGAKVCTGLRALFRVISNAGLLELQSDGRQILRTDGTWASGAGGTALATAAPHHVHVGVYHGSAVAVTAGDTWSGRLWWRKILFGEIAP